MSVEQAGDHGVGPGAEEQLRAEEVPDQGLVVGPHGGDVQLRRGLPPGIAEGQAPTPVGQAEQAPLEVRSADGVHDHVGPPALGELADLVRRSHRSRS